MPSILQRIEENHKKRQSLGRDMYDLGQQRMRLLEKLYDDVIIPVAKELKYEVFLDMYNPLYKTDKGHKRKEWEGGGVPEHVKPVSEDRRRLHPGQIFTNFQTLIQYQMDTPASVVYLAKKEGEAYARPIKMVMREMNEFELEIQKPVTEFLPWSHHIDKKSPRKDLRGEITYWEKTHGDFADIRKNFGMKAACFYYASLLDSRGFEVAKKEGDEFDIKRVGRMYQVKAKNSQNDWVFSMHDKGGDVKVEMDIDDAVFEGMASHITVFKKGKLLAEKGKVVPPERRVSVEKYYGRKK